MLAAGHVVVDEGVWRPVVWPSIHTSDQGTEEMLIVQTDWKTTGNSVRYVRGEWGKAHLDIAFRKHGSSTRSEGGEATSFIERTAPDDPIERVTTIVPQRPCRPATGRAHSRS